MRFPHLAAVITAAAVTVGPISTVNGQAYCALRDPVQQIHELFPNSTAHRSIVKAIDRAVQKTMSEEFGFTLHKKEFGQHTVYVALQGGKAVGVVHSRTEKGKWGLNEITWALSSDMQTVVDFAFQRCRDPSRAELLTQDFKKQIIGKNAQELAEMLTANGAAINPDNLSINSNAETLAADLLRSAIKTLKVTQTVYSDEVRRLSAGG